MVAHVKVESAVVKLVTPGKFSVIEKVPLLLLVVERSRFAALPPHAAILVTRLPATVIAELPV